MFCALACFPYLLIILILKIFVNRFFVRAFVVAFDYFVITNTQNWKTFRKVNASRFYNDFSRLFERLTFATQERHGKTLFIFRVGSLVRVKIAPVFRFARYQTNVYLFIHHRCPPCEIHRAKLSTLFRCVLRTVCESR